MSLKVLVDPRLRSMRPLGIDLEMTMLPPTSDNWLLVQTSRRRIIDMHDMKEQIRRPRRGRFGLLMMQNQSSRLTYLELTLRWGQQKGSAC